MTHIKPKRYAMCLGFWLLFCLLPTNASYPGVLPEPLVVMSQPKSHIAYTTQSEQSVPTVSRATRILYVYKPLTYTTTSRTHLCGITVIGNTMVISQPLYVYQGTVVSIQNTEDTEVPILPMVQVKFSPPYGISIHQVKSPYHTIEAHYGLFLNRSQLSHNLYVLPKHSLPQMTSMQIAIRSVQRLTSSALNKLDVSDVISNYNASYEVYAIYIIQRLFPIDRVRLTTRCRKPCLTERSNHAGHRENIFTRCDLSDVASHQDHPILNQKLEKKSFRMLSLVFTIYTTKRYIRAESHHITYWSAVSHSWGGWMYG